MTPGVKAKIELGILQLLYLNLQQVCLTLTQKLSPDAGTLQNRGPDFLY
jgi:hypothetical protein